MGVLGAGARHLRAEWGRWWRVEDLTDTHCAHLALNEQWRMWEGVRRRHAAELKANMGLLQQQQRQATYMQMQRLQAQRRGGYQGRGGYGGGFGMFGGGASPMVSYRMMQWAQLQIRMGQEHFQPQPVTPPVLAAARDQVRTRRHRTAGVLLLVLPAAWIGVWVLSVPVALVLAALGGLWFTGLAYARGRNPRKRRPPIPRLLFVPPAEVKGVPDPAENVEEPFALAEAGHDPRQVREAVRLAFLHRRRRSVVEIGEIGTPVETQYGWEVPLVLRSGTLADFPPILRELTTPLRVGAGRIMAAAVSPEDTAAVKLRILTKDPFKDPLPIPVRAPGSCSIQSPFDLGLSIEGQTTPVVLAGQHAIVVADTGGGKTALIQRVADFVTACHDAVIVDIDPVKRGLKVFSPLAAMTARSPEDAEDVLAQLVAEAERRIASMPPTQNIWSPTADAPAVVAVLDEFIKLSDRGKALAITLLRNLGREALISVVIITQDATQDVLSDAIADVPGLRIMLPCRAGDVPLVVGRQDAVSLGWWPHLLVPSPDETDPADAGRFYVIAPRHRDPILRYASMLPPEEAARRVQDRLAAPRPRLVLGSRTAAAVDVPAVLRLLLAAFAANGDPDALTITDLGNYLVAADPAVYGQWEGKTNRNLMIGRTIRSALKDAGVDVAPVRLKEHPGKPTGYRRSDIAAVLS